jgi:hypothetical protein
VWTCFQSTESEADVAQRVRDLARRRIAHAARRPALFAQMYAAAEERARRQYDGFAFDSRAVRQHDAAHAVAVRRANERVGAALHDAEVRRRAQLPHDRLLILRAIGLHARSVHRGAFAAIQHAELNARLVGGARHQPVASVDLANQMTLADATYSKSNNGASNASNARLQTSISKKFLIQLPIDGLQLMTPIVSNRCVNSAVRAPIRAAAAAASVPA